jgi:hypothetical protein
LIFRGNAMPISSNATSLSRLGHGPHARGFEPSGRSGRVPQVQRKRSAVDFCPRAADVSLDGSIRKEAA